MLLRYIYDQRLAQASYLVGDTTTKQALVIDPARDITPYLHTAETEGLHITQIVETHIHADFVSGSRQLATHTGATLYLSDMGDVDWKYTYPKPTNLTLLHDGDHWQVGSIHIAVIHTPGHTPEHIALQLTDQAIADSPMGIFTGDFLFVSDVGRPDLLENAAGQQGTATTGARQQFHNLQRFASFPDYLQIWPGHGAGSACGKAPGAVPSTTLGYEKRFNPAFRFTDEEKFVTWLLDDQPETPRYFAHMKLVNKRGPALLHELAQPARIHRADLDALLDHGAQIFDLRSAEAYSNAFIPGTLNIPATTANFSTYAGWFVDYQRPLYLILPALEDAPELLTALHAIGIDDIEAISGPEVVMEIISGPLPTHPTTLDTITAPELAAQQTGDPHNPPLIVDVRGRSEYNQLHIAGAGNIPLGHLPQQTDTLPHDRPIIVHCTSGYRAQIAASLLAAHGFDNVRKLEGNMDTWSKVLPVESEKETSQ